MALYNLPASLTNLIQQNYLKRDFSVGLNAKKAYRMAAESVPFSGGVGTSIRLTRMGRKATAKTPLSGSSRASNLQNGLTPTNAPDEQIDIGIEEYGDAIPLNLVDDELILKSQFLDNARVNGEQSAQTLDELCRDKMLDALMAGDTRVTAAGSNTTGTVYLDDVRGFETVFANGTLTGISGSNKLTVTESGTQSQSFTISAITRDVSNTSSAATAGGWSGVATISPTAGAAPVVGNRLQAADGSVIIRAGARSTTAGLLGSDLLRISHLMDAARVMDRNNVPRRADGTYMCILDHDGVVQLTSDPEIQTAFQGRFDVKEMRTGFIANYGGISFYTTNLAPIQTGGGVGGMQIVHRAMLLGQGLIGEADFQGKASYVKRAQEWSTSHVEMMDSQIISVTRGPIDVLAEQITQAWKAITGWACYTDTTTNTAVTPTASNARYKRGAIIEFVGS